MARAAIREPYPPFYWTEAVQQKVREEYARCLQEARSIVAERGEDLRKREEAGEIVLRNPMDKKFGFDLHCTNCGFEWEEQFVACPYCKSQDVVRISYGLPDSRYLEENRDFYRRVGGGETVFMGGEEVLWGGCTLGALGKWFCKKCREHWPKQSYELQEMIDKLRQRIDLLASY